MAYQLGIDLGTTFTCAAVCRSSDRRWAEPEVVTLGSRGATVPSVIFLGADGSVVVGEAAERRALTDPDRVVREFKRRIGDPTPVMVAGRPWAPQDLSARLVRWVVDRVAEREGGPADRISVTHPASWGQHKKEMLAAALAGQGLTVTFLAEPQAAALHYAANERVASGSTIAVYDFGGGTFDAAVVRKRDTDFGLLGRPEGLERLGGIDFDQVVFEHVLEGMPDAFAELDETDPAVLSAVARIRRECTEAKEALSSDTEVSIPVLLPGSRGSVRLHRSEFEAMIRPQVEDTVSALRAAVISAGLAPDQLTAVLLVGGSSRIPLVAQLVSEQLGRPVAVDADPKNAIAKGAALALAPKPAEARPGGYAPLPAAAAAGPVAPPARPPRMAPPPPGGPGVPYGGPYNDGQHRDGQHRDGSHQSHQEPGPPPRGALPRSYPPPSRPAPEPAAAVLTQAGPPPTRRAPQPEPDWDYEDYDDYEPEPRRRRGPNVMAIGVGALLAVGAVVLAVILWPTLSGSSTGGADDGTQRTSAPASSGGRSGDSGSADRPNPPAAPPAAVTTTRAPETSEEEPPPDSETTSEPTEPTDESDPDQSGDANGGGSGQDSDSGGDAGEGDSNASGPVGDPIEPVADEVEEPGF